LKGRKESCVLVAKSSDTWSITVEIREKERRGQLLPKISLKHWGAE